MDSPEKQALPFRSRWPDPASYKLIVVDASTSGTVHVKRLATLSASKFVLNTVAY
jgi:hypothetical protein